MKKYLLIILALTALAACKPTEKNYRNAYDKAAEAARRKAEADRQSINGEKMEALNGPRVEIIDDETVMVSRDRIKPFESELSSPARAGVAIARYGMPANARRHADDLKNKYPDVLVADDGSDHYYVIISTFNEVNDAVPVIREFRKNYPDYSFIGLPDGPLVLFFR